MGNEIEDKIAAKVGEQKAEDAAGKAAATMALPGPLKDAFAVAPEINVGKYSVRQFCDVDFRFLQAVGHPIAGINAEALIKSGKENLIEEIEKQMGFIPTGENSWRLYWILTRPTREVRDRLKSEGAEGLSLAAETEFGELQFPALQQLLEACVKQFGEYWSTTLEYGPAGKEEGEKRPNPPSSEAL